MNSSKEMNATKPQTFDDLNLPLNLLRGIYAYGFEIPAQIQSESIPIIISGKDLIAQSLAGTGKTGAFAISALTMIDTNIDETQVIILSPTRELAQQTGIVLLNLSQFIESIKIQVSIGGTRLNLAQKNSHVTVGTPGRIADLIRRKNLNVDSLKLLVLDEADELLSRGFVDTIQEIMKCIPFDTQIVLFSGTIGKDVLALSKKFMKEPFFLEMIDNKSQMNNISQFYLCVEEKWKFDTLLELYKTVEIQQCIIYCNTKQKVNELTDQLKKENFVVSSLHADMTQEERNEIMKEFRTGSSRILISTDLLARGIDVQQISLIINYEMSAKKEIYVHRIGRTGRYNKKGFAISFVSIDDAKRLKEIENCFKVEINELPEDISFIN